MQFKQGVSIKLSCLTKNPQEFDAIKKLYPGSLYYETDQVREEVKRIVAASHKLHATKFIFHFN